MQEVTDQAQAEPKAPPADEIPKDLSDLWGSVQATATAFTCLNKGLFSHDWITNVKMSLAFLQKLHEQQVEQCLMHPKASLIPELQKLVKAEVKRNGKKAKRN